MKIFFHAPFSNSALFPGSTIVNSLEVFQMFLGEHLYRYVCVDIPTYIHVYNF